MTKEEKAQVASLLDMYTCICIVKFSQRFLVSQVITRKHIGGY